MCECNKASKSGIVAWVICGMSIAAMAAWLYHIYTYSESQVEANRQWWADQAKRSEAESTRHREEMRIKDKEYSEKFRKDLEIACKDLEDINNRHSASALPTAMEARAIANDPDTEKARLGIILFGFERSLANSIKLNSPFIYLLTEREWQLIGPSIVERLPEGYKVDVRPGFGTGFVFVKVTW